MTRSAHKLNHTPTIGKVYSVPSPSFRKLLSDAIVQFFVPRYCPICQRLLDAASPPICPECLPTLPRFHNAVHQATDRLQGLPMPVAHFYALFQYYHTSTTRQMMHQLKYGRCPQLGFYLGMLAAQYWHLSREEYDYIVPVPLHKKKLAQRGYNQSQVLAQGISAVSKIPVVSQALCRTRNVTSQTTRNRYQRLEALQGVYQSGKTPLPIGSHVLLVDDLLTTGATLRSAAEALMPTLPLKLGIFTLAVDV